MREDWRMLGGAIQLLNRSPNCPQVVAFQALCPRASGIMPQQTRGLPTQALARQRRPLTKIRLAERSEDQSPRDLINDRMASEFERVAKALGQIQSDDDREMLSELGRPRSDLAEGAPSSFSREELDALQAIMVGRGSDESQAESESVAGLGKTISCGGEAYSNVGHSAVVTGDGRLFAWGSGQAGRLGRSSTEDETAPAEVVGLEEVRRQGVRIRAVSCGYDHSACVTEDGRVFVWGSGSRGQVSARCCAPREACQAQTHPMDSLPAPVTKSMLSVHTAGAGWHGPRIGACRGRSEPPRRAGQVRVVRSVPHSRCDRAWQALHFRAGR